MSQMSRQLPDPPMPIAQNQSASQPSQQRKPDRTRIEGLLAIAALLVTVIMILTACAPIAANEPEAIGAESGVGPLQLYWQRIYGWHFQGTLEERQAMFDAEFRAREEYIAACMASQGFVYTPDPGARITLTMVADPVTVDRNSREFAELYGFGIGAEVRPEHFGEVRTGARSDIAFELMAGMSEAEAAAFGAALWGTGRLVDGVWDGTLPGCMDAAWALFQPDAEFAAIRTEMDNTFAFIGSESSPDFVALNSEWSTCMIDAGFPDAQTPAALERAFLDDFSVVQGCTPTGPGYWACRTDYQPDPVQHQLFNEREIAAAVANYDCREEVDFDRRHRQLGFALEQEFVNQHRNELEAAALHAEQRRASAVTP